LIAGIDCATAGAPSASADAAATIAHVRGPLSLALTPEPSGGAA
jgi:hypothetical protein